MKRAARVLVVAAALAVGLSTVGATPSPAAARPRLSGRIVHGVWSPGAVSFTEYWITGHTAVGAAAPVPYCSTAPDCAAWLASGCSTTLAGRDPAWATSIEDVRPFADGSTPWVFSSISSFSWGTLQIELWDRDCNRVDAWPCAARWYSCAHRTTYIPKHAAWMTVVSTADNANTTWTLR